MAVNKKILSFTSSAWMLAACLLICCLAVLILMRQYAQCQPPLPTGITSVWIDPWQVHALNIRRVGDEKRVSTFFDQIGDEFSRLIITVFANGRTLHPTSSSLFRQSRRYMFAGDPLKYILDICKGKRIEVYAAIDVLLWTRLGTPEAEDIFKEHPELMERNVMGGCGDVPEGKYASPWNEKVRQELRNLVEELAKQYPTLSGIVLNCRLSSGELLGYSESARVAYIRANQIDPIDIHGAAEGSEEWELYRQWYQWKRDELGKIIADLRKAFLESNPNAKVAVIGNANFYRWKLGARNMTCADWASWAASGTVNEVLLMDDWLDEKNKGLFKGSLDLIEKAVINVEMTPVLQTSQGNKKLEVDKQWEKLVNEDAIRLVVKVMRNEDLTSVAEFLKVR